jgi:hypothetical protein
MIFNSSLNVFRLGILQGDFEPYTYPCGRHIIGSNAHVVTHNCRYPGIAIEAIDFTLRKLQLPYETVAIFEEDNCGALRPNTNRSDARVWTGYLGALQAGKVDLLVGDFTPINDESTFIFSPDAPISTPFPNPPSELPSISTRQSGEEREYV